MQGIILISFPAFKNWSKKGKLDSNLKRLTEISFQLPLLRFQMLHCLLGTFLIATRMYEIFLKRCIIFQAIVGIAFLPFVLIHGFHFRICQAMPWFYLVSAEKSPVIK